MSSVSRVATPTQTEEQWALKKNIITKQFKNEENQFSEEMFL